MSDDRFTWNEDDVAINSTCPLTRRQALSLSGTAYRMTTEARDDPMSVVACSQYHALVLIMSRVTGLSENEIRGRLMEWAGKMGSRPPHSTLLPEWRTRCALTFDQYFGDHK